MGIIDFPISISFFSEGWYERALKLIDEKKDHFLVTTISFGLFERTWTIRGFENALIDSAANPDFYQELIKGIFEQYMALLDPIGKY